MDTALWMQETGGVKSMASISSSASDCTRTTAMERKARPQKDQALNCPRCHSTNTKFCYYNNYSLTQPRYFCKSCRRYWTEGGTLRNVPVGGGSRKNKNPSSGVSPSLSMATSSFSPQKLPDMNPPSVPSQNPKIHDHGQDLNLGFQATHDYYHGIPQFLDFPKIENRNFLDSSSSSTFPTPLSPLNLRNNGVAVRGLASAIPPNIIHNNTALFTAGFQFQESKPSLAFPFDGFHGNSSNLAPENINESFVFPLGPMKRHPISEDEQAKDHENVNSNAYWNGMLS